MIDERMEEQASLHVLGALTPAEAREFKQALLVNPELRDYVARLTAATGALAGEVPLAEPPPQLRAKILAQVAEPQKMVSLSERKFKFWLPWTFATALAIGCILLFAQDTRLSQIVGDQGRQIDQLNQLAQSLQSATNNLQQTVLALQETNRLAGLRIAMLNSLVADAPKAIAVSLWDSEKQDGVFVAQNLKPLAADRDYQLWIIDPKYKSPVDAGVVRADANGSLRVAFKAKQFINDAKTFAVTEEAKGGADVPTLKNLVLASK
jgi:anti-sigma-K factor RskA